MPNTTFDRTPNEIVSLIFTLLDPRTLITATRVCTRFWTIIMTDGFITIGNVKIPFGGRVTGNWNTKVHTIGGRAYGWTEWYQYHINGSYQRQYFNGNKITRLQQTGPRVSAYNVDVDKVITIEEGLKYRNRDPEDRSITAAPGTTYLRYHLDPDGFLTGVANHYGWRVGDLCGMHTLVSPTLCAYDIGTDHESRVYYYRSPARGRLGKLFVMHICDGRPGETGAVTVYYKGEPMNKSLINVECDLEENARVLMSMAAPQGPEFTIADNYIVQWLDTIASMK